MPTADELAAKYGATVSVDPQALAKKYGATVSTGTPTPADDADQHGYFRSIWDHVKGFPQGIAQLANATMEAGRGNFAPATAMVRGIANASGGELEKAHRDLKDALDSQLPAGARAAGAYGAVVHSLGSIPVIGPAAISTGEHAGNQLEAGNYAGAAGTLTAGIGEQLLPKAIEAIPANAAVKVGGFVPRGLNKVEQAAVDFGDLRGINTAQVVNNPLVKNAQKATAVIPGGYIPAAVQHGRIANQLKTTAAALLDDVRPGEVTPELAGQSVQDALNSKAALHTTEANSAYDRFRQIESDPGNVKTVQVGTKNQPASQVLDPQGNPIAAAQSVPVMKDIPLPIAYAPIKAQIQPIVDALTERTSLLQQQANPALTAMRSMLEQPEFVQASHGEEDLGALKSILRDDNASPRAKALATQAIRALDGEITKAAAGAGPDAIEALRAGRAATYDQYATDSVLDKVVNSNAEPVATFRKLTAPQDANINALRSVVKETPAIAPQVGRAYLQHLLEQGTEVGGLTREAKMLRGWDQLGDSTKKLLYNPMQIQDLDNFFNLAKKLSERPSPSMVMAGGGGFLTGVLTQGGHVNIPAALAINGGAGALASLLYSPKGIRLLTQGMKIPVGNTVQAAKIASQLNALAGRVGASKTTDTE